MFGAIMSCQDLVIMTCTVTAFKLQILRKQIIPLNSKFEIRELKGNCWGNNQLRSHVDAMTSQRFNPQV